MTLSKTLKGISAKLIDKFGNDLVLTKLTQGVYDPQTGTRTEVTEVINTKGVDEESVGEHSNEGDMKITFVSDVELDAFDKCTYKGTEREIISIQQVAIENLTIVYQMVVTGDARRQV